MEEQDRKRETEQGVGSEEVLQRAAVAWSPWDSEVMTPGSATPSPSSIKTLSTSKAVNLGVKTGFFTGEMSDWFIP